MNAASIALLETIKQATEPLSSGLIQEITDHVRMSSNTERSEFWQKFCDDYWRKAVGIYKNNRYLQELLLEALMTKEGLEVANRPRPPVDPEPLPFDKGLFKSFKKLFKIR